MTLFTNYRRRIEKKIIELTKQQAQFESELSEINRTRDTRKYGTVWLKKQDVIDDIHLLEKLLKKEITIWQVCSGKIKAFFRIDPNVSKKNLLVHSEIVTANQR